MTLFKPNRLIRLCLTSLFLLVTSAGVHAGGTAPGTDIDNQATTFKVDLKEQSRRWQEKETG